MRLILGGIVGTILIIVIGKLFHRSLVQQTYHLLY
jgi:hypothetical protein